MTYDLLSAKNISNFAFRAGMIFYGVMIGYYNHGFIYKIKHSAQAKICSSIEEGRFNFFSSKKEGISNRKYEKINIETPERALEEIVQMKLEEDKKYYPKSIPQESEESE